MYDGWGNPGSIGGLATSTPFGYAGAYTDPTGLLYLLDRYYDPQTGQFLSVDPELQQTDAPYDYADDDPVNATDPTGNALDPNGCTALLMNPHISSTQRGRPVKVNARLQYCEEKPVYGEIWVQLWKTGFLGLINHLVASTDVNSNQKGHRFFKDARHQRKLKYQMRDYSTLHACDNHTTETTFFARMRAKVRYSNGKEYFTPYWPDYRLVTPNVTLKCHTH